MLALHARETIFTACWPCMHACNQGSMQQCELLDLAEVPQTLKDLQPCFNRISAELGNF